MSALPIARELREMAESCRTGTNTQSLVSLLERAADEIETWKTEALQSMDNEMILTSRELSREPSVLNLIEQARAECAKHDEASDAGRQWALFAAWLSERLASAPAEKPKPTLGDVSNGSALEGWERECQDGDKIAEALGIPRTEGGSLNVTKMLAKIRALSAPAEKPKEEPLRDALRAFTEMRTDSRNFVRDFTRAVIAAETALQEKRYEPQR